MFKALEVRLTAPADDDILHRFKNFGERVYVALRDEFEVSITEIDTCRDAFFVQGIHKREARTVAKLVRKIAEKERMTELVEVLELEDEK